MTEVPVLHGSSALGRLAADRPASRLHLVPAPTRSAPVAARGGGDRTSTERSAEKPLTLTRRGRLLFVGIPVALGVAALILLGAFLTSQAQAGVEIPSTSSVLEVNVVAGETLWDLAVRYAPERDPRDVIAEMVELNSLRTSVVQAGQSIAIPSEG
ncbi:LysM peptidoglycan-binding domain-containing protein [Arthrobacter agilis]|uniref:LysM peptidoglycan-binding domain-containing protein n=1 Tax=Arthrobacter agilis TaxID=37921 RepID=UPI002365C3E9|nr:LysM peptidoglycan-binding domain-containing protein [Arthrobacter agilis]WDF34423.1 LysM peptidoglycan-binding domain-containing protein [Arthrobacter agilis]